MISIIQADFSHLNELSILFDQYRQFYKKESDLLAAKIFLEERLIHQQSVIFLALDENNKAIGFTQLYPIFSSVSMKKLWLLNDLFVLPEARNKKIGYQLLEKAKNYAQFTKAKGLMLQTAHNNFQAQSLYKKFGFIKDEEFVVYDYTIS